MSLSEVMTPDPITCRLEDSIQDCARLMADHNLGFLPVVDEYGTLVGTITDRDIVIRSAARGEPLTTRIQEIYSDNPIHLSPEDTLAQAEDLMMDAHIRRLVAVDDEKKPVGVLSLSDIGRFDKDLRRVGNVFAAVLEPMPQGRTIEGLIGSACCG